MKRYSARHGDDSEFYMSRAIRLAAKGEGYTSPNPIVGCVVVKNGRVISEGYHEKYGEFHAERNALLKCEGDEAKGADLYVNLEPCCHQGKTPPCTDIIIEKGIKRVYVSCLDPNPLVAGKGVQILKDAGIEVKTGVLYEEGRKINEIFFHYMETGLPFVGLKYAMSADGKIACAGGDSKWITGDEARGNVQRMRKRYSGIMVGIGTVLKDDPMLNCRIEPDANPVRIICDSSLNIPEKSNIVATSGEIKTIVAYDKNVSHAADVIRKAELLKKAGVSLMPVSSCEKDGKTFLDLKELLQNLAKEGIDSVLAEGGGTLNSQLLSERLVNKVYAYVGMKLIGGKDAPTPVEGKGAGIMAQAVTLKDTKVETYGNDICIVGYPEYPDSKTA